MRASPRLRIAWTGALGGEGEGGVPGLAFLLLRGLVREGHEVDVFLATTDHRVPAGIRELPNVRIVEHETRWRWGRWYSSSTPTAFFSSIVPRVWGMVALNLRVVREHRRRRYDVVFQMSQMEPLLLGRLRRWLPPLVTHPCAHAAGELRWHRIEQDFALASEPRHVHFAVRAFLRLRALIQAREAGRADLIIGPSRRFNELMAQDYGIPASRFRVLRHAVDTERYTPLSADEEAATPPMLVFVSRLSTRKGFDAVVTLSHRLDDLHGQAVIHVVGGKTLWSDYTAHVDKLNPRVAEYHGYLASSGMPDHLRRATAMLLPSRYEPGSLVAGEALASGLPLVVSDEVGPSEIVDETSAVVFRAGDDDAFEAAVRTMLDRMATASASTRAAARAVADRELEQHEVAARFATLLREAAGR